MKSLIRILIPLLGFITLAGGAFADATKELKVNPSEQVEWMDTPFGVQASPVQGDFSVGKHITFIKFKAGTATPAHVHSHDYTGIVIKGRGVHYVPSEQNPTPLTSGSFWFVPAGVEHISGCLDGEDCVFALNQDEPFDYIETK